MEDMISKHYSMMDTFITLVRWTIEESEEKDLTNEEFVERIKKNHEDYEVTVRKIIMEE